MSESIALARVTKRYDGVTAVNDVSLDFTPGSVTAIIGSNGAGKTTLLRIILGLLVPDTGTALISGVPIDRRRPWKPYRSPDGLAAGFQYPRLINELATLDNVVLGVRPGRDLNATKTILRPITTARGYNSDREVAREAIRRINAPTTDVPAGELSFGERRRVELARIDASQPSAVIFDEPGAGLDADTMRMLAVTLRSLARRGVTVVIAEHKEDLIVDVADEVITMESGTIMRHVLGETWRRAIADASSDMALTAKYERPPRRQLSDAPAIIEAKDLSASYSATTVFHSLSFSLRPGELILFTGPNGSGKSTALKRISGILPGDGTLVFGLRRKTYHDLRTLLSRPHGIALSMQGGRVFAGLTIRQHLELAARHLPAPLRTEQITVALNRQPRLHNTQNQHASTLSGGERQLLNIERALLPQPSVLLLDEPITGLDDENVRQVIALLKQHLDNGGACVVVEHRTDRLMPLTTAQVTFALGEQPTTRIMAEAQ